jgi:fumarate hydratase subunit beta
MGEIKRLTTPLSDEDIMDLRAGESVLISGKIYTARDAAHKRFVEAISAGEPLPIDLNGAVIYYAGPCPAKPGQVIGSIGPTTSSRMDPYAPKVLKLGLKGMIGKGLRSDEVVEAIKESKAVYFAALGGAGALLSQRVKDSKVVAYEELGTEAVRELLVQDFPAIVVIDSLGNDLYKMVREGSGSN